MQALTFKTKLIEINSWPIVRLPEEASAKLPSRGMTMVEGTLNGVPFATVLEPDGNYMSDKQPSHWFQPKPGLLKKASAKVGDEISVDLTISKEWIEPELPQDVHDALASNPKAIQTWNKITPIARWDWVRWIRAVKTEETRKKHIEVMLDKLNKGMRRPCCFNRALCSVPEVSHNWRLLDASN
jgi:hypothetical protein